MKEQPPRKGRRRSSSREATDTAYTNTRQPRRARRESNQRKGNAINGIPKGKVKEKKKKRTATEGRGLLRVALDGSVEMAILHPRRIFLEKGLGLDENEEEWGFGSEGTE